MRSTVSVSGRMVKHGVALVLAFSTAGGAGHRMVSASPAEGGAHETVLSVNSDPAGATVYVDGRFVGQTPLTVPALPAGDHRVRLVKDGYLENSRIIKVNGDKVAALQVRLTARGQADQSAQAAGLKIVVIAGEDAVNIIQQKTAVNPVVEVRDRNDLPVAGVPVTFAIAGQNAAFGSGLQTVTVTTNAAGRAAVTGLNPLGSGTVQINVTAASQGQTATATISQTNFATAAAAAQAGATVGTAGAAGTTAAAGAGAAAGGGGLSGLAIAGIVGGAGAAAVVGAKAAGVLGGGGSGSATPCTFTVSPTSVALSSAGGNVSISVTHAPNDCEPKGFTATSNAPFITGGGETTMVWFVEINPSGNPQRTGTITIAGQTVTVTQAARCAFTVSPSSLSLPGSGGTATVTVTASPAGCDQASWTASTISNFVTLSPTSGTGNGIVTVTVPPNTSSLGLTGNLSIAGLIVSFVQAGSGAAACLAQLVQGADVPEARTIQLGSSSGRFTFRYDNGVNNPDRMVVTYEGRMLFDTGCAGTVGVRTQPLSYAGHSTTVTVQVTPNCRGGSGSTWFFELSCSP